MTDCTRNSPPHRSGIEHRITFLLVFSVTSFKINQNKNQNSSNDKVQNLEEKEGKYAKTFAKIQVTAMFLTQDMRRNTQIHRDFDGDAMLAPIQTAAGNQRKHLSLGFASKA